MDKEKRRLRSEARQQHIRDHATIMKEKSMKNDDYVIKRDEAKYESMRNQAKRYEHAIAMESTQVTLSTRKSKSTNSQWSL